MYAKFVLSGPSFAFLLALYGWISLITNVTATPGFQEQKAASAQNSPLKLFPQLQAGRHQQQTLTPGQIHRFPIQIEPNQFVSFKVEQQGIDLQLSLLAPDGHQLVKIDRIVASRGEEYLVWISQSPGLFQLQIETVQSRGQDGAYGLVLAEQRPATSTDGDQVAAQTLLMEGRQLAAISDKASKQKAIEKYQAAFHLHEKLGDQFGQAQALTSLGEVYFELGDTKTPMEYYDRALPLWTQLGDRRGLASVLNNMGTVWHQRGEHKKSQEYYLKSLEHSQAIQDTIEQSGTLLNLSLTSYFLGDASTSIRYAHQALEQFRKIGNEDGVVISLNTVGGIYLARGDVHKALPYFEQILTFDSQKDNLKQRISNNLGALYEELGEYQKAIDAYQQGLRYTAKSGNKLQVPRIQINLAKLYGYLGEKQRSEELMRQALEVFVANQDKEGQIRSLTNLGTVKLTAGEYSQARDLFLQAQALSVETGDRTSQIGILQGLGDIAFETEATQEKAIDYYTQVYKLATEAENVFSAGHVLERLGDCAFKAKDYLTAIQQFTRASEAISLRQSLALVFFKLSRAYFSTGQFDQAEKAIVKAIEIREFMRSNVKIQELRQSVSGSTLSYYLLYIQILLARHQKAPSAGFDKQALEVNERARARTLLELLTEAKAEIRKGVPPELLNREMEVRQLLNYKENQRAKLSEQKRSPEKEAALSKQIETLFETYRQVQLEIRDQSPQYAALTQPQPLTVKQIQAQLDPDTVLLEYALAEPHSILWIVTPTTVQTVVLPDQTTIAKEVRQFVELVTARTTTVTNESPRERKTRLVMAENELPAVSDTLTRLLLEPAAPYLKGKRLLIVASGVLQYLPFAALSSPVKPTHLSENGYRPLIADFEVVSIPSVSTLSVQRNSSQDRLPGKKQLAVLADPVFSLQDQRVSSERLSTDEPGPALSRNSSVESPSFKPDRSYSRLVFSQDEANRIAALVPPTEVLKALDFQATRSLAVSDELSQYRFLHFATHGYLDTEHPEFSAILFSMINERGEPLEGYLRMIDVFNLNLPAELVVLSACQTGLGKNIESEGLVGLTRGFMYAGAKRVVVSLWKVSDSSTSELMVRFYTNMLKKGQSPAAALRSAQLELWQTRRFKSPYYWAPFVIQGEWK